MSESRFPALADLVAKAHVITLPLNTKFRGLSERELVLIEGTKGWTEWSPFVEYSDEEAATWLTASIEFGFDEIPMPLRTEIPINATLPAINNPDEIDRVLARFGSFTSIKIKVAESTDSAAADLARISYVAEKLPNVKIRLDANGAWSVDEAVAFAKQLSGIQIEYLEQPCQTLEELDELKKKLKEKSLNFLIAADESVRKANDPAAAIQSGAADVLILKNQPLGGVSRVLQLIKSTNSPVVISSALESSVGISMSAYLAAAIPNLEFTCGLGTAAMLQADVTDEPLIPIDGKIPVRRVDVSPEKLIAYAASDERKNWWLQRLERCYKIVAN